MNTKNVILVAAIATVFLIAAIGSASAADCGAGSPNPVCNCGDTVVGDYTFTDDLDCSGEPADQPGLYIGAPDITINGAGYTMTGNRGAAGACDVGLLGGAAPPGDQNPALHSGIVNIGDYNNVKITDLTIREFCTGIAFGDMLSTDVDFNEVTNCSIYDCGDSTKSTHGIHMVQTNNCNIKCSSIHDIDGSSGMGCSGGGNGIFMYGNQMTEDGWYNSFTCNDLSHNAKSGFFMKHQCKYNYLGNNHAVWNGEGGIVPMCMRSDYNTYDRNNLSYNYKWGFMTRGTGNEILNNTMIGNGRDGRSPGISISNNGDNVVNDNCVCGSGGMDIAVNGFATCADNTCDTTDCAGGCQWNCDNLVSVYYDFDEDASYSGLFGTCCNLLNVGTGNNPGLFSESGAPTHCDGGFCIYPDPGDDTNDCCGVAIAKPDLVITFKNETWINQDEGTYNITYTVCNIGSAAAGESRTKVMIDGVPTPPPGVVPALDAGECFNQTLEGPYTCTPPEDTIKLCADGPGWIDESNENNNCRENVWVCGLKPDLVITNKKEAWVNATHYNITYTACNIGDGDAGASKTKVMIDGVPTGIPGNVPALGSGNCSTETLPYTIEMSGDNDTIKLCADGPGMIHESNETNNCLENVFKRPTELADLIIKDTVPFCWCCCRIPIIMPLKGGDGEGEGMPVMFIDNPELAKELGGDEKLREQVAEALAKDPKLAAEIAVKLAGDDTEALAKFTRDPREFSKAEFAEASEKLLSKPELVDHKLIARCCCRRGCNSIKELADLLGDGMNSGQQTDMSELLYKYGANGWWCTDGCGGGCCCSPWSTTDRRCCCCCGYGVAYKIANVGDGDAGWSLSTLFADVHGYWHWHVRSVDIVRPLDAGQSRWEVFPYYSFGPDRASRESLEKYWKVKATVCADATDWVAESDETNNCRTEVWKWPWCCWYPKK